MKVQSAKSKKQPIIRAVNKPGSEVGKKRYDLYAYAFDQITKARAAGFYIECIAILESIIADRLEARRACLNPVDISKHRFWTLGTAKALLTEETSRDEAVKQLYQKILDWSEQRDVAIHEMVKLESERRTEEWEVRYQALNSTVDQGSRLARHLSQKVKALNKQVYAQRTEAY